MPGILPGIGPFVVVETDKGCLIANFFLTPPVENW